MIEEIMTLSTAHISKKVAKWLETEQDSLIVYPKAEYGWFILVDNDDDDIMRNVPDELAILIKFAVDNHCNWLCLDADGELLKDVFATYEW